jgi:hypothetical protein
MKKFMLSFFGGNMALRANYLDKADKEAQEKHVAAWAAWMSELVKGKHLETGYPLMSEGKKVDADCIQDYHFPDATEGGFVIIQTESIEQAAELAKKSPIIKNVGYVLVRLCGEMK